MGSFWQNRRRLVAVCVLTMLVIGGIQSPVKAQNKTAKDSDAQVMRTEPGINTMTFVPHQLVVRLATPSTAADSLKMEMVQSVQASLTQAPVYLVNIDPSLDEEEAAAEMRQSSSVIYAHPNYRLNSAFPIQGSYPFSDERFVGSIPEQYGAGLLRVAEAHQLANGAGVTVAVIDGGVDIAHPEIGGAAVSGYDYVDADVNAIDEPGGSTSGHGTFVAGLVHLMAPQATIKSYRVMNTAGNGDGFTLARAIEQAALDGCDVINLSVALTERHHAVREAIDYASSQGVLVVAGAGNNNSDIPVYPAAEANVIAVAAVDSNLQASDFTSFGSYVDVSAPGTNVYSAYQAPYNAWWSGTSFSAPFVSGLAALLVQAQPTSHWLHVRNAILYGARSLDSLNPTKVGGLGHGVIDPVGSLTLANNNETAAVIPDTMHFTHYEGAMYAVIPFGTAMLVSSNGPAAYTAEVRKGSGPFAFTLPKDSVGMTGDTVVIYCQPYLLPPGEYTDTVLFAVEGVADPARLIVGVTVVPVSDTVLGAYVTPGSLWFVAQQYTEILLAQNAVISSHNAPANYQGSLMAGGAQVVTQFTASGTTNDTITVVVDPSLKTEPGLYVDSISYQVDGIANPALLVVYLQITDSSSQGDSAWIIRDSLLAEPMVIEEGSLGEYIGCLGVYSTNAPSPYTVSVVGSPKFAELMTSSGQTNSNFCFGIGVDGLIPGAYTDTFVVTVDNVVNSPILYPVTIIIVPAGGGGGSDSVIVTPQAHEFLAVVGLSSTQYGLSVVMNAGGPTAYTVTYLDPPNFTELIDTAGVTDDSITFRVVNTPAVPAGVYKDTLLVYVSGVGSPFIIVNTLTVGNGEGGGGTPTAYAAPSYISVAVPAAVTDTIYRGLTLVSSNAPAAYTASILDAPAEFVSLPKVSGWTNDSILIVIGPNGLSDGIYEDSIVFQVTGVADPVLVVVRLAVGDSSFSAPYIVTALQNFPNPFNPSTTIQFALERAANVTLEVFNMLGQQVKVLVTEELPAGTHAVVWTGIDGSGHEVGSGIYFYRLTADGSSVTRKMLLVK